MWQLNKQQSGPFYSQLITLIEAKIASGELLPGEKLPPERKLAKELDVNRSTVARAFDELKARGILVAVQGSGTHVNEEKWGVAAVQTNWRHYVQKGAFNHEIPYIRKMAEVSTEADVIDLATGELPLELAPSLSMPEMSWQTFLQEENENELLGYMPLRKTIRDELKEEQELVVKTEQILVTSGAQQALFLITQCLLAPFDAIAIEAPSYFYSLSLFQSAGLRIFALPMDEEGVKTEELKQLYHKHRIKMVFVNPTFQNPTGRVMSEARRLEFVKTCSVLHIPIVEDDPFGPLTYKSGQPITPLKKLDEENVLYIGSLSKVLGSTTRIGFLVGPVAVVRRLAAARQEMDFGLSIFPQVLANQVLSRKAYKTHIQNLHVILMERAKTLTDALTTYAPEILFEKPVGGFHLWVELPLETIQKSDFDALLREKLLVMPGYLFGVKENKLRLSFAQINQDTAVAAAKILQAFYEGLRK
ncbi:MocR-like pyridoxine biosynthesis transcription factor PdxR [Listeria fleischmannii]|uniref:PLP-dependent aminotransferase family protein n=1 Tax=Listeria fleischmannii TaxID=1069827 RepID=A0A841YDQ9_9LIST|nr:PLP-dependent aminotransferase family protein [Listeria fleischmannii]MBC1398360.1 PLP-dependent aminotransferase family protein [Listeria fleischmannii]MBC1426421.1 PLP-dependent aminotransferase family protein [Listeria fleischmannii]STY35693.1 HTH-type transcriptional regulator norG [Listeria fleischmannii subsp. coloradonensis]